MGKRVKTRKVRNICFKYRRQFMFTAAVYKVKQNQNNQRALRINLMTILDFLISR